MPLKTDHNDIVVKIGYTEDITERFHTLESEYKCKPFFIKAKIISGKKDETAFHSFLKSKYEALMDSLYISKKKKTELYKLSPVLMYEYDRYLSNEKCDNPSEPHEITSSQLKILSYIKEQELKFHDILINLGMEYDDVSDKVLDYLKLKETHHHECEMIKLKYNHIDPMWS